MSRRAVVVSLVVVGLLAALVVSARLNPVYQSHAVVSPGFTSTRGLDSIDEQLALARSRTVRAAVEARYGSKAGVRVGVVDGSALEFRARGREPRLVAELVNAYAEAYVDLRSQELAAPHAAPEGLRLERLRALPLTAAAPHVVVPAVPARSPLRPWPSETWTLAGMVLVALALAVPETR